MVARGPHAWWCVHQMLPSSAEWLTAAAVVRSLPHSWLHEFTERADAAFIYVELAVWCQLQAITSFEMLQARQEELRQQGFWKNLLTRTTERLDRELGAPPEDSRFTPSPHWVSESQGKAYGKRPRHQNCWNCRCYISTAIMADAYPEVN